MARAWPVELVDAWIPTIQFSTSARPIRAFRPPWLRRRLSEYRRHGAGQLACPWVGRMIWQLADSAEPLVAWRLVDQPRVVERSMIADFTVLRGWRLFANRMD
ncbi:hypothetical protein [Nocardia cyriacigeorgica]